MPSFLLVDDAGFPGRIFPTTRSRNQLSSSGSLFDSKRACLLAHVMLSLGGAAHPQRMQLLVTSFAKGTEQRKEAGRWRYTCCAVLPRADSHAPSPRNQRYARGTCRHPFYSVQHAKALGRLLDTRLRLYSLLFFFGPTSTVFAFDTFLLFISHSRSLNTARWQGLAFKYIGDFPSNSPAPHGCAKADGCTC